MARRCGRCKRGKRLRAAVPHGHYKTLTFVSDSRLSGLVAPKALDGPMNAERFEAWLRDDLGPTLKEGDIVVMDNLQSHKSERVKFILERFGASVLYLPPYSPDMNPIEKAYAKLKAYLRKLAERTVPGLMALLEACADIFNPKEAANFFAACGYDTDRSGNALAGWHGPLSLTENIDQHFDDLSHIVIGDAVVDLLPVAAERDETFEAQPRKLLRHGGLADVERLLQLADVLLAVNQLAKDLQPRLVGQRLEEVAGFAGAGRHRVYFAFGQRGQLVGSRHRSHPSLRLSRFRVVIVHLFEYGEVNVAGQVLARCRGHRP